MPQEYLAWLATKYAAELVTIQTLIGRIDGKGVSKDEKQGAERERAELTSKVFQKDGLWPHFLHFYLTIIGVDKDWLVDWWRKNCSKRGSSSTCLTLWNQLIPGPPCLAGFPPGSWTLDFHVTLAKPYLSKDDNYFHFLDNPIKREAVFKLPYISPAQWKGSLRASMVRNLVEWWNEQGQDAAGEEFIRRRLQIVRLFGNEKEVELEEQKAAEGNGADRFNAYLDQAGGPQLAVEYRAYLRRIAPTGYLAGRLHFYPTVFAETGLEVINPHDRVSGAGTKPIYLETIPKGQQGRFAIFYVPFGPCEGSGEKSVVKALADLEAVAEGLEKMLTLYGIGAKTSGGFGIVGEVLGEGTIRFSTVHQELKQGLQQVDIPDEYRKYLTADNRVRAQFLREDRRLLSNTEYRNAAPSGGGSLGEFKRFRRWLEQVGRSNFPKSQGAEPTPSNVVEKSFTSFIELKQRLKELRSENYG
ncbi:MAG TPA: hypothetical protein GXX50_10440 [Firmicutes bacterium]|nr:hypothetical protein [Bacillota bacterium]